MDEKCKECGQSKWAEMTADIEARRADEMQAEAVYWKRRSMVKVVLMGGLLGGGIALVGCFMFTTAACLP